MLPSPGPLPADDTAFGYEFKWDGVRAGALVRDGRIRLFSRNQRDITATYPELAALGDLTDGRQSMLDGEIVALDPSGRPSFEVLQRRMHVRAPGRGLVAATPVWYYVFDVTHLDGLSTRRMSYVDRRGLLEGLGLSAPGVEVPPWFVGGGVDVLEAGRERGLEGVLAKRLDSPYQPGRRSHLWVKVKLTSDQEVVIGGWRPGEGRRSNTIGSLLVAVPGPGGLRYAGRVGTGFTEAMLRDLMDRLRPLERPTSPFAGPVPGELARGVHWVEPRIVGEVRFTEWTLDGVLRHPSWRGIRADKSPEDITLSSLLATVVPIGLPATDQDPRRGIHDTPGITTRRCSPYVVVRTP